MQEVRETDGGESLCDDFTFRVDVKGEESESESESESQPHRDAVEEEGEEEEFSFCSAFSESDTTIGADEIFEDGRIRPVYPVFNSPAIYSGENGVAGTASRLPVKKVFVEPDPDPEGPFCEWDPSHRSVVVDATPSTCRKSNSTGFSKMLKVRELAVRSNSDGKDAFVFLSPGGQNVTKKSSSNGKIVDSKTKPLSRKEQLKMKTEAIKGKEITAFSAHYERSRARKEVNKRASYLPYRVGFFTNVNGMSKNLHPY